MEFCWIEDIKKFQDIAKKWDEALVLSGEDNPFLLSDFIISWWKYYFPKRRLMIYVIYDQGRIIAGIPLCIERRNFRKTIVHVGGCNANVTHFFSLDKRLNFAKYFISSLKNISDWDVFVLDRVACSNSLIEHIENVESKQSGELVYYIFNAGLNGIVDLTNGYEAISRDLSKRLKRYLAKGKREIAKLGELRLGRIRGTSQVKRLFSEFRSLSIKSFRARNDRSAFEDKNNCLFYEELLARFDMKQRLDAHKLSVGPHTLSISFGYRFGKSFKWILTTFNPDFYRLRPGHLLIEALINESIKLQDSYFDMYYGGELFYKQQWCTQMIPLRRLEICRNNLFDKSLCYTRNLLRSKRRFIAIARNIRKFA